MDAAESGSSQIELTNLREFFRDSVQVAMRHQHVAVQAETEHYLVAVLTRFANSDDYYQGPDRARSQRPLALLLGDALHAVDGAQQRERLQKVGDVALFMAGFFAQSFARKLVDVDYCIAMGGRAYATLADSWRGRARGAVMSVLFGELAAKFQRLVDVLNEVADSAKPPSDLDLLRHYEIWLKTSSPRSRRLLEERGIIPLTNAGTA